MKKITFILAFMLMVGSVYGAVPLMINHQGIVKVNGEPFTGNGLFKFGFIDETGKWLWTNDGTHLGANASGTSPDGVVIVVVNNGVYNVRLGDTSILGMVAIPVATFTNASIFLRVIFDDGTHGQQVLAPDQPVCTSSYAMHAAKADDADTLDGKHASEIMFTGAIIMWSGTIASIPSGWALCDGNNGTPDLRDKFIVGARQDDGGVTKTNIKGSLMKTGGEHQHTLTIGEMPAHNHRVVKDKGSNYPITSEVYFTSPPLTVGAMNSGSPINYGADTETKGGGQAHENCPPFFALAFIMKL